MQPKIVFQFKEPLKIQSRDFHNTIGLNAKTLNHPKNPGETLHTLASLDANPNEGK